MSFTETFSEMNHPFPATAPPTPVQLLSPSDIEFNFLTVSLLYLNIKSSKLYPQNLGTMPGTVATQ